MINMKLLFIHNFYNDLKIMDDTYYIDFLPILYALESDKEYHQYFVKEPINKNETFYWRKILQDTIFEDCIIVGPLGTIQKPQIDPNGNYVIDDMDSENILQGGSLYRLFNTTVALNKGKRKLIVKNVKLILIDGPGPFIPQNDLVTKIIPVTQYTATLNGWQEPLHSGFKIMADSMMAVSYNLPGTSCAILGKVGFDKGVHRWNFTWTRDDEEFHPVIGIGESSTLLYSDMMEPLVGEGKTSYGWHLGKIKMLLHDFKDNKNGIIRQYPNEDIALDHYFKHIVMILDMENKTLSFIVDGTFLGVAVTNLPDKTFYPMVSTTWCGAKIHMRYVGSYFN